MVGLLIVSHSRNIAEGVKELADQMTQQRVPILAAGGTPDGSLGTSAEVIMAAAEQLRTMGDLTGVLVFVDLGSAVMSAEIAMEGFDLPFILSNAPLVEGAVIGAVEASLGSSLEQVAQAADQTRELRKIQD